MNILNDHVVLTNEIVELLKQFDCDNLEQDSEITDALFQSLEKWQISLSNLSLMDANEYEGDTSKIKSLLQNISSLLNVKSMDVQKQIHLLNLKQYAQTQYMQNYLL